MNLYENVKKYVALAIATTALTYVVGCQKPAMIEQRVYGNGTAIICTDGGNRQNKPSKLEVDVDVRDHEEHERGSRGKNGKGGNTRGI
jgi:hypothetical protein